MELHHFVLHLSNFAVVESPTGMTSDDSTRGDHHRAWNRLEIYCNPIEWYQIDSTRPPRLDDDLSFGVVNRKFSRSVSAIGEIILMWNLSIRF